MSNFFKAADIGAPSFTATLKLCILERIKEFFTDFSASLNVSVVFTPEAKRVDASVENLHRSESEAIFPMTGIFKRNASVFKSPSGVLRTSLTAINAITTRAAAIGTPVVSTKPIVFISTIGPFSPAPMFDIIDSIRGSMKNRNSSTTPEAMTHRKTGYARADIIVRRSCRRASI